MEVFPIVLAHLEGRAHMRTNPIIVAMGVKGPDAIPGLKPLESELEIRYPSADKPLSDAIRGADIVLGWDFKYGEFYKAWKNADQLKWIFWAGAGVDPLLFPELVESDVVLTNCRGVFDRSMAEYTLGLIIAFGKHLPESDRLQSQHVWKHRLSEQLLGKEVLIVGVGSIGREIARVLNAFGMKVSGVGRRHREDQDFGVIYAGSELNNRLASADFVVVVCPSTPESQGMFGANQFQAMKCSARLINISRGNILDEAALLDALRDGVIAGAALDVFTEEPLSESSPFWDMDNVIVSPHMSADFHEHLHVVAATFFENLKRYRNGEPMLNVIDKRAGFSLN
jgi:phosphoglycerate dehydrogenase-like enzyme